MVNKNWLEHKMNLITQWKRLCDSTLRHMEDAGAAVKDASRNLHKYYDIAMASYHNGDWSGFLHNFKLVVYWDKRMRNALARSKRQSRRLQYRVKCMNETV